MILYTFISYMIESKKMDCYCLTKKQKLPNNGGESTSI